MATIQGKAYWAKLRTAENQFDPERPKYSIDVALDKAGVKQMEAFGVPIKENETYKADTFTGQFVTLYKDQFINKNGQRVELPKPRVLDSKKQDISDKLIGNGSVVKVSFYPKEWTFAKKTGVRAVLKDVQVLSLIEYGGGDEFEEEEDGYVADDAVVHSSADSGGAGDSLEFD
jgi:hypothetical protein